MNVYVSDKELAARYKNSRATIWRWVDTRAFPKPIKFSPGCTRWRLADVQEWEARIASRRLTSTSDSRSAT